jgi:uncharacterized protein YggU (UPF0235/DUF167 family)
MAPRTTLPDADAIRALIDGDGRLAVRVTPGARREEVALGDAGLVVKVTVAPEDGKANAAVIALVAKALGVARSRITLLRGDKSREKLLRVG